jgi:cell division protein FtsQ
MRPLIADSPIRRTSEPSRPRAAAKPAPKAAPKPAAKTAIPVVRARAMVGAKAHGPGPLRRLWDRRRRLGRATKVRLAAVLASLAIVGGVALSGVLNPVAAAIAGAAERTAVAAGLTVQNVTVTGRRDTPQAQVLAALGVTRGQPILGIDTEVARARLQALGWVRSATVTRLLPDTLHVELVERSPMAVWQNGGKRQLIDQDGVVIEGDARAAIHAKLPLVVGAGAAEHAAQILAVIESEPRLAEQVSAVVRVGARRWDVKFDNGVTVRLPETDEATAWRRLASLDRAHGLLNRAIEAVDMRLADRLVVRMTDDAAKSRLGPAKNT